MTRFGNHEVLRARIPRRDDHRTHHVVSRVNVVPLFLSIRHGDMVGISGMFAYPDPPTTLQVQPSDYHNIPPHTVTSDHLLYNATPENLRRVGTHPGCHEKPHRQTGDRAFDEG